MMLVGGPLEGHGTFTDGYRCARDGRLSTEGMSNAFVQGFISYHRLHLFLDDKEVGIDQEPCRGPRVCLEGCALFPVRFNSVVEIGAGIRVLYDRSLHRVTLVSGMHTLYLDRMIAHEHRREYRLTFENSIVRLWLF